MIVSNKKAAYIAIVIAAGLSERMGSFKPLLDVGGRPALLRLVDSIKAAGIEKIFVVTGHEHTLIEDALDGYSADRLSTIYNTDYPSGMFSSVKAGIREAAALLKNAEKSTPAQAAALFFPADVPLVSAETIAGLVHVWERSTKSIAHFANFAVPAFEGKNGHPLLIPEKYFDEILNYTGEGGLKGVRSRYDKDMIRYETNDAGCVLDMDTPEDYKALLGYEARKKKT
jgi:CTP:molybdopterin cytidylyltransferase MocA